MAGPADTAQELFDRGVAALEAGNFADACPAIAQSLALDPLPGTLFTLAECEAKGGHLATARARYDEYLVVYQKLSVAKRLRQGDREQVARAQKDALAARVPMLTLILPVSAPPGTVVARDMETVPVAMLGVPVAVNPGDHKVSVQLPGRPSTEMVVSLSEGQKKDVALELPGNEPVSSVVPPLAPAPLLGLPRAAPPASPPYVRPIKGQPRRRVVVEAAIAGAIAPSMGGDIAGSCSGACKALAGTGVVAGGYAGYELAAGFGFGVAAGYLLVDQRLLGRTVQVTPVGLSPVSGTADDTLRIAGGMLGGALSVRLGKRLPITGRLGAGVFVGHAGDARSARFTVNGTAFTAPALADSQPATDFYLAPELRVGLPLGHALELAASLRGIFLFGLTTPTWGQGKARPVIVPGAGYSTYRGDVLMGSTTAVIAPGLVVRYSF